MIKLIMPVSRLPPSILLTWWCELSHAKWRCVHRKSCCKIVIWTQTLVNTPVCTCTCRYHVGTHTNTPTQAWPYAQSCSRLRGWKRRNPGARLYYMTVVFRCVEINGGLPGVCVAPARMFQTKFHLFLLRNRETVLTRPRQTMNRTSEESSLRSDESSIKFWHILNKSLFVFLDCARILVTAINRYEHTRWKQKGYHNIFWKDIVSWCPISCPISCEAETVMNSTNASILLLCTCSTTYSESHNLNCNLGVWKLEERDSGSQSTFL